MPITNDNGIVTPINSDPYNLTTDLATMADSVKGITPVSGWVARNALEPYEGRVAYRTDTGQLEFYTGGAWRDGTRDWAPLSPSGWSSTGTITVTPEGQKKRVIADLIITRTSGDFSLPSASWSLIGTVVPASAAGTAPVKYLSVAVVGGGNNYTANASFNPAGAVSIRATGGPFTFTSTAFFTINVAYYI